MRATALSASVDHLSANPKILGSALSSSMTAFDDQFWSKFEEYLTTNYDKKTVYDRLSYARRYAFIMNDNSKAQDLLALTLDKRKHAMKALAVLSKYLGRYNEWKEIKEQYQLKWSNGDSIQFFENAFNEKHNYTAMLDWLKTAYQTLPKAYGNILLFSALTGLRPDESCKSVSLIKKDRANYLKDSSVLEHYKYPKLFIRRTKKAYISVITDDIISLAKQSGDYSYTAIRCALKQRGMDMHMGYCRKIYGTYLRMNGIEPEIIDLLQGRVPKSVFSRHYFRPDFNYNTIRKTITSLHNSLKSIAW